jgi:hypothetical protein
MDSRCGAIRSIYLGPHAWLLSWQTLTNLPMPKSTESIELGKQTSFLLIGDSGTLKTTFLGTLPKPTYIIDTDNGLGTLAGIKGIDYDTFNELPYGEKITGKLKEEGFFEWGIAWPAIIEAISVNIGRPLDKGTCIYKSVATDSLTMLTDICTSYILKNEGKRRISDYKDGRQFWGAFLNNMSEFFGQLNSWPLVKACTAHVRRDENQYTGLTEKMPLVPGQFSAKVSVYFDEVYFTDIISEPNKPGEPKKRGRPVLHTETDSTMRQARSRTLYLPTATLPPDYQAIMDYVAKRGPHAVGTP